MLSLAALPAAIAATRWSKGYELLDAAAAIPVAVVLGILAILLARRARNRVRQTLAGARGARAARIGRVLGLGEVDLLPQPRLAEAVSDLEHRRMLSASSVTA